MVAAIETPCPSCGGKLLSDKRLGLTDTNASCRDCGNRTKV